ncbi:lycopene cyclase domain-containing protein [Leucobacter luti]|uniref:lycopene cyclase domain-containing protein n=1 Tax=Leucobacter luti TaxID=340320 RepID=UPI00215DB379|nr:lycopene cyclase domain-containing protein [Leucobacter luti]
MNPWALYPVATLLTMIAVILIELLWLKTGIFRTAQYWVAMVIMLSFQVLVDGWLTKLSNPIVIYTPETMLGVRFPWDIPVEDFGFGFAMLTLTLLVWKVTARRSVRPSPTRRHAPTQTEMPPQIPTPTQMPHETTRG